MFLLVMQMSQGLALAKEQFDKLEKLWEGICSHLSLAFFLSVKHWSIYSHLPDPRFPRL